MPCSVFVVILFLLDIPIGVVPPAIMESLSSMPQPGSTTPPTDGLFFHERAALGVYRSLRRQRRRSVGGEKFERGGGRPLHFKGL